MSKSKQIDEREIIVDGVAHRVRVFAARETLNPPQMAARDDSRSPWQSFCRRERHADAVFAARCRRGAAQVAG